MMYYGRYGVGVNAFVCFYSIAQALVETHRLVSRRLQSIVAFHCITLFLDQACMSS